MEIKRAELLKALETAKIGLGGCNATNPSFTQFLFRNDHIFTFNNEMAAAVPFKHDLDCAVPANEFYSMVSKIRDESLILTVEEKDGAEQLMWRGKGARGGIALGVVTDLPLDFPEDDDFQFLPANFCDAISNCLFTVYKRPDRVDLSNVHIGIAYAESCDVFRITRMNFSSDMFDDFLLPLKAAKDLIKMNLTSYVLKDGWAIFRSDLNVDYYARLVTANYPDMDRFLDVEGVEVSFPKDISNALDKAEVFADMETDRFTEITIKPGRMIVRGQAPTGWVEEQVRIEYEGEEVQILINPTFLKQILGRIVKTIISPLKLKFIGDDFEHIMCAYEPNPQE